MSVLLDDLAIARRWAPRRGSRSPAVSAGCSTHPDLATFRGAGQVVAEGWNGAGGIVVLVRVGNTNSCVQYAHLSAITVDVGQKLARGQQLGRVGGSGFGRQNYYAPHLHWAGVSCSTSKAAFIINTDEMGTSYDTGAVGTAMGG